jgi:hypothetical protein
MYSRGSPQPYAEQWMLTQYAKKMDNFPRDSMPVHRRFDGRQW